MLTRTNDYDLSPSPLQLECERLRKISDDLSKQLHDSICSANRLSEANYKLSRDAERYRYLRKNTDWLDWDIVVQAPIEDKDDPQWWDDGLKLDNAIDFVMGRHRESKHDSQ